MLNAIIKDNKVYCSQGHHNYKVKDYKDDSQVVELTVYKRFTEETERVEFELKEIKESEGVK